MAADRRTWFVVPAAAALLLWPALWNGYPIVFADTGTYLSQAIHRYAGWDRPVFYSMFMFPLHATVTLWPVAIAQALLTAWVLWLVCRTFVPGVTAPLFIGGAGLLAAGTWLPFLVSEAMPDLFTPLMVLLMCLLALGPPRQPMLLAVLAAFMIATQLSSLPLACGLAMVLGFMRSAPACTLDTASPPGACCDAGRANPSPNRRWLLLIAPPVLAVTGLCVVNLAAHGRFGVSPFGNIFMLARVIYDGPGMTALRRDCPSIHWRLCPFLSTFPPTSDDFLWTPDSPLNRAGGPKIVSRDADAIIRSALRADPVGEARAALDNTLRQLVRFQSGDGLTAWPDQVSPVIARDFPARELAAYTAARQQAGSLSVPPLLAWIHRIVAVSGVAGCVLLLPAAIRRRSACAVLLLAVLIALPLSAAITGGLSAPHDRYQARIMWLPPFSAVLSLAALRQRWQTSASARQQSCPAKHELRACPTPQSETMVVGHGLRRRRA